MLRQAWVCNGPLTYVDESACAMTAGFPTNTDPLAAMLQDPEIRESLAVIVANAPALAALSSMATGVLARGPELADNVNGLVDQLRTSDNQTAGTLRDEVTVLSESAPPTPLLAERKNADVQDTSSLSLAFARQRNSG